MAIEFINISNEAIIFSAQLSTKWPQLWYITEKNGHKRYMLFEISILRHARIPADALSLTFLALTFTIGSPWLSTTFEWISKKKEGK